MLPADEIAPLIIYGITEMWVVLIASSAAPLWPLFRKVGGGRAQYGPNSVMSPTRNGYLKSTDTNDNPMSMASGVHAIASRHQPSRSGSEDDMLSPNSIMMVQDMSVKHEDVRHFA